MMESISPAATPLRRWTLAAGLLAAGAVASFGAAWLLDDSVGTDDAYVQGNIVQLTPRVSGTVLSIEADDTDAVRAGQTLIRLDPTDAKVALLQAEAQLGLAVREAQALFANNETLKAQIALRDAEVSRVSTDRVRLRDDLSRRANLLDIGAIGREEFEHVNAQWAAANDAVAGAEASARAARRQLVAGESFTANTTVADHPSVRRAEAHLREAWLALKRTEVPAPVAGQVARRGVQVGQRVQAGAPLMTIVPLDTLWVDANFKENQLHRLRVGQRATLRADVYGRRINYRGTVAGLGAGTGAAFALLPAQNATGNWVKVVQRVPVRILLEPEDLAAHPLRVGLSMQVRVDTADTSGPALSAGAPALPPVRTRVFDDDDRDVDAAVRRIVSDNSGRGGKPAPSSARPYAKR